MTPVTWLDAIGFAWLEPLDEGSLFGLWLRLGWGLVVGTLVGHLMIAMHQSGSRAAKTRKDSGWAWITAAAATLATWLAPGPWSAAHWLGLAFFAPSGLLVGLCAVSCWLGVRKAPGTVLPTPLALALAIGGTLLYASHLTALPWDLYPLGQGGALWLLVAASAVALGLWWQGWGLAAWAVATALLLHSLLGLPTANAWDAVLDPWLWLWALAACARRGFRRLATMRAQSG